MGLVLFFILDYLKRISLILPRLQKKGPILLSKVAKMKSAISRHCLEIFVKRHKKLKLIFTSKPRAVFSIFLEKKIRRYNSFHQQFTKKILQTSALPLFSWTKSLRCANTERTLMGVQNLQTICWNGKNQYLLSIFFLLFLQYTFKE